MKNVIIEKEAYNRMLFNHIELEPVILNAEGFSAIDSEIWAKRMDEQGTKEPTREDRIKTLVDELCPLVKEQAGIKSDDPIFLVMRHWSNDNSSILEAMPINPLGFIFNQAKN